MRMTNNTKSVSLTRTLLPVMFAYALVGLSFGTLAISAGLPPAVPILLSLLVFAGSAQFAALGVVLGGGGALAAVAVGLVINARLIAYSFAVRDALGAGSATRLAGAHLITDVNTALVLGARDPERPQALFWRAGIAVFAVWNIAVAAGVAFGGRIADTQALGLDAVLPAILFGLIRPALNDGPTARACLAGASLAVLTLPWLPAGAPVLLSLAGLAVGLPPAQR
ncbi:branched-chain amino acid ABC transporter permease [Salinisphaera orenii MK-B5]|uniref:Branched-chain amino acid ABC transporter permease n=1 Tax=Salinisphaera orenii MK-B5 TaxID=856730 RepID=A0A423PLG4_9GAMM|nr:branched-chain amino acid ABC transporter permease [Salinisphaera orenii MK-B5]